MNSRHRPRVSLGDAVGPLNTTPPSLINIDGEADDPLLSFASERPSGSSTPERPPVSFAPERPAPPPQLAPVGRLELAPTRPPMFEVAYRTERWADARPKGVGGSVVAAFLVLGILIGFAGGYTSVMFSDAPPVVPPPEAAPTRASEPPPLSAASVDAVTTKDAWEHLPVGTQSEEPVAVEPGAGTATNRSTPNPPTTIPVASAVAPLGSIDVVSRPPGAAVAIDGRLVGTTPLSIPDVTEGTHVVGIELAGFSRWATSVYVNKGERARVGASLSP
jgi:hypothetical protein